MATMVYVFGGYELDEQRFELRQGGTKVPVQPKVLDVLFHLVRARERVVLKRELLDTVWADVVVSEASVSRVIMEARKAIGDELQQVIATVRGRGFRFAGAVSEKDRPSSPPRVGMAADPTFVGRDACMAALEARLAEAAEGRGSVVWLSGEAGIGKTRTADEITRRGQAGGATTLTVRAHESPATPPFWVWAQLLRTLAAARGDAAQTDLANVQPLLAGEAVTGAAQFALFEAATRVFLSAARARPMLLVFDDMQWADEGSLLLLQFFARELRSARVLAVGTYRDTSLGGDARARALGGLLREAGTLSIPLRGLSLDEIPRFVETTTGSTPSAPFARALYDRSGGNPLYLHQLVKTDWAERALTETAHELASSMDLQQGLIESICRHLDALSEGARELLTTAALLGREFELAKLGIVCGLARDDLLNRLDEAARARVLVKAKDGGFRFAHVLVRDVLCKKLPSAERAARHGVIGEKLAAHYGESSAMHAGELADQFARALPGGDAVRAVELSMRAAEQETALGEHRAAARLWEQAARALEHLHDDEGRRLRVQLGLAKARARAGQEIEARGSFLDAAILARTFARFDALAEAALGFASLPKADESQRRALLEEARVALAAAKDDGAAPLKAKIDAALSSQA
jgi:predicted ATPase/DNA-binding winged helix-turn-helix (wHTH) protein